MAGQKHVQIYELIVNARNDDYNRKWHNPHLIHKGTNRLVIDIIVTVRSQLRMPNTRTVVLNGCDVGCSNFPRNRRSFIFFFYN
jgi:hypothetical protein